jgi:pullulanase
MRDDRGSGRRVQPRPLHWKFASDNIGTALLHVYQKLIGIRNKFPSMRSDNIYSSDWEDWQRNFNNGYGLDADRKLVIFHRWDYVGSKTQRFIIVLNFSQEAQEVDVPFSCDGQWQDLLQDTPPVSVSGNWLRGDRISSNWGKIYFNES